jgi:hypothetical protein
VQRAGYEINATRSRIARYNRALKMSSRSAKNLSITNEKARSFRFRLVKTNRKNYGSA